MKEIGNADKIGLNGIFDRPKTAADMAACPTCGDLQCASSKRFPADMRFTP
jgi:hypothetical protein